MYVRGVMVMILNDKQIIELAEQGMITPFCRESVKQVNGVKALSFGVSSFGYDLQVADEFRILKKGVDPIDPKNPPGMQKSMQARVWYRCCFSVGKGRRKHMSP